MIGIMLNVDSVVVVTLLKFKLANQMADNTFHYLNWKNKSEREMLYCTVLIMEMQLYNVTGVVNGGIKNLIVQNLKLKNPDTI